MYHKFCDECNERLICSHHDYIPPGETIMQYIVQVEGEAQKSFSTIDKAIEYGSSKVYLSSEDSIRSRNDLENGQIAEWSYGFNSVLIIPR